MTWNAGPASAGITGRHAWNPHPTYEVITVEGTIDVIEHRRMEPIFYLNDDASVWKELGVLADNRGGR
jgi:hypothetical protein